MKALTDGHGEIVLYLLENGANVETLSWDKDETVCIVD